MHSPSSSQVFMTIALFAHLLRSEEVLGFAVNPIINIIPLIGSQLEKACRRIPMDLSMSSTQNFNPFTQRQKNNKVRWFEADLDAFYAFVENQPLLTASEELQYGKACKMWSQVEQLRDQYNNDTRRNFPIDDEELASVIGCSVSTLEKMGPYAEVSKNRLVNSNLKLVMAVVSRYRTAGIPNAELIAEGTRGLSKAVLRYDYTKGFRFATYATWYVHQAIADYVRWRKHPAKMPSRYLLLQRKVKDFSAEFKTINGRLPSVMELSINLDQKQYDVIKVLSMQAYPTLLSATLGASTRDGGKRERAVEEIIPSLYKAPFAMSGSKDLRRDMEQMMLVNLNDVERDVLRLRLGLDDGRVRAVKEVGKRFKISWKQVRCVEKEALSKLLGSVEINEFVDSYNSV